MRHGLTLMLLLLCLAAARAAEVPIFHALHYTFQAPVALSPSYADETHAFFIYPPKSKDVREKITVMLVLYPAKDVAFGKQHNVTPLGTFKDLTLDVHKPP